MWRMDGSRWSRRARFWSVAFGAAVMAGACGGGSTGLSQVSAPNGGSQAQPAQPGTGSSQSQPGAAAPQAQAPQPASAQNGTQPAPAVAAAGAHSNNLPPVVPKPGTTVPGTNGANFASDVGVTKDTITVGIINMVSATRSLGPVVSLPTERMLDAISKWVNDNGGIAGRKLKVLVCDDGGDVSRSRACYEKLKTQVFAFMPSETWLTDIIHDQLIQDRVPWMSWGWFTSEYKDPYMFPCHGNGLRETINITKWVINNRHPKTVGILYLNDPEDIAGKDAAVNLFQNAGVKVVQTLPQEWDSAQESQHVLAMRVANPDAVLMLSWPTPIAKFFHEAEAEHWAPPLGYYAKHHVADPGFGPIFGDYIKDRFYSINSWVIAGGLNQPASDNNLPGLQFWKMLTQRYTGYDLLNFHFKYTYGHHITQSAVACSTIFIDVARKLGPNLTRPAFIAALESQPWETGMGQVLKWPHGDHGQEPYSFNKEPVYLWTGAPDGTFEVKRVYPDAVTNS